MGLPLSKKLAQLLRGDVAVSSTPGLGSTFVLDTPLRWQADVPAQLLIEGEDKPGIPILVLENRSDDLLLYSSWFKDTAFRLIPAATVREAELQIAALKPALIVLDVLLDGEDSWGLLASLKNSPETRGIPILMITTVDDRRKALHLGADDYLVKPVSRESMLERIRAQT